MSALDPLDLGRAFWRLVQPPGDPIPDDDAAVRQAGCELLRLTEAEREQREAADPRRRLFA